MEYVGFWLRVVAAAIDSLWLLPVLAIAGAVFTRDSPALFVGSPAALLSMPPDQITGIIAQAGSDSAVTEVLLAVAVMLFWLRRSATPGKMAINARIVDAQTGRPPSPRQLVIRYIGYYVSILPLLLGLFWIGWDRRKQGWHDKLAGTVVVRPSLAPTVSVQFPNQE